MFPKGKGYNGNLKMDPFLSYKNRLKYVFPFLLAETHSFFVVNTGYLLFYPSEGCTFFRKGVTWLVILK